MRKRRGDRERKIRWGRRKRNKKRSRKCGEKSKICLSDDGRYGRWRNGMEFSTRHSQEIAMQLRQIKVFCYFLK